MEAWKGGRMKGMKWKERKEVERAARPFIRREGRRVAVKGIDPRGNEVMGVHELGGY